nr:probable glutamyl endopeptidase, chloroplastic isoform X2 [Ipomoea batatas]
MISGNGVTDKGESFATADALRRSDTPGFGLLRAPAQICPADSQIDKEGQREQRKVDDGGASGISAMPSSSRSPHLLPLTAAGNEDGGGASAANGAAASTDPSAPCYDDDDEGICFQPIRTKL